MPEDAEAGVFGLDGEDGEGEMRGFNPAKQAYAGGVVGAGDDADMGEVFGLRPLAEAFDVLVGGGGFVEGDLRLLLEA